MKRKVKILIILTLCWLFTSEAFAVKDSSQAKALFTQNIFTNTFAKVQEKGAIISWSIDYNKVFEIENVIIRYKPKVDKSGPWKYTKAIAAEQTSYKLENLKGGENYVLAIGCRSNGANVSGNEGRKNIVWTESLSFKTERKWGLFKILVLMGSLGLFIFGMKLMSEGLQQTAGGSLRKILSSMTSNRIFGVASGFFITALVQSSSATTVMTVSFVNAGLLTLVESAGVMMGANIGTTITGWLVSLFGFKISLSSYALIFIALGAPLMFIKRKDTKAWGNTIIGFALVFMGLGFLKDSVPDLAADSSVVQFFTQFSNRPFIGRIAFVLLGTLVTIVVQSSSAAMALTLTLVSKDIIPFEVGAAMILGENVGTTITAEIASLVGNVHAKRSARIHSVFNIIGVTWMILLMPIFLNGITSFMQYVWDINPTDGKDGATIGLAAFHTVFNLTNVLALIGFVPWLVKVAQQTVKSRGEQDEVYKLEYITSGILATPELSLLEAKKEVAKFADLTFRMHAKTTELIFETENKKRAKLIKKMRKYEEVTDMMESEISAYLGKVSSSKLASQSSSDLRSMLSIINDLERIGDIYFEISKEIEKKTSQKLWFDQKQRDGLSSILKAVNSASNQMLQNLNGKYSSINMQTVLQLEIRVNEMRDSLRKKHFKSMEKGDYNAQSGLIYSNIFASLERVGDHIINVSESASGIHLH